MKEEHCIFVQVIESVGYPFFQSKIEIAQLQIHAQQMKSVYTQVYRRVSVYVPEATS